MSMSVGRNGIAAATTSMAKVIFTGMASWAVGSNCVKYSIENVAIAVISSAEIEASNLACGYNRLDRAATNVSPPITREEPSRNRRVDSISGSGIDQDVHARHEERDGDSAPPITRKPDVAQALDFLLESGSCSMLPGRM